MNKRGNIKAKNNTPNKKICHASAFSGSVNFLCGRLGIDASASRRVVHKDIYIEYKLILC